MALSNALALFLSYPLALFIDVTSSTEEEQEEKKKGTATSNNKEKGTVNKGKDLKLWLNDSIILCNFKEMLF